MAIVFWCLLVCRIKEKNFFWSTEIFCWVEFYLKFDPIFHFREFTLFLWQPKTMFKCFINLKVMVLLERGDQGLSIGSLKSFLPFRLVGWNFTWKLTILTVENAKFVKLRKKYKMAETPLSSGQNAFPRSFGGVLGGYLCWKVLSDFWFGHRKYHFWYPWKA